MRGERERPDAHRMVNRFVLARACALVGAVVAGFYVGFALSWVGNGSDLASERIRPLVAAAAGAAAMTRAAVLLERACRVSSPDGRALVCPHGTLPPARVAVSAAPASRWLRSSSCPPPRRRRPSSSGCLRSSPRRRRSLAVVLGVAPPGSRTPRCCSLVARPARAQARQAQAYTALTEQRVARERPVHRGHERAAHARGVTRRSPRSRTPCAPPSTGRPRRLAGQGRGARAEPAEAEGRAYAARLDETEERAAEAIVRVAELEQERDALRAELDAAPRRGAADELGAGRAGHLAVHGHRGLPQPRLTRR